MSSTTEFLTSYESIKTSYKKAMTEINTAVSYEENERPQEAIKAYEHSIGLINEIFQIPVGLPDNVKRVEPEWNDACSIIQKLKNAKSEISYRLNVLRSQYAQNDNSTVMEATEDKTNTESPLDGSPSSKFALLENPTVYSDTSNDACNPRKTYQEIIKGLRDVIAAKDCDVCFDTLFQASAKVYKIQNSGIVTTVAGETTITLVLCTVGGEWKYLDGVYFLQCSFPAEDLPSSADSEESRHEIIWIYPLIPSITTCYRTEYGAFILPDLEAPHTGAVFGIMLSDTTAGSNFEDEEQQPLSELQQHFQDLLEAILAGQIVILSEPQAAARSTRDTSKVISKKIVSAADFISRHLIGGAEKTGELMLKSTPYVMSKLKAAPPDAPPVYQPVQTSVDVAKNVTGVAAGVTYWVASKVGTATMALGRYLAPHIQTQGAYLLENGLGYDSEEAHSKMEGAFTIAAGALEGFNSVYNGLETSAKILGKSLSSNSVKIIEHKYGPSAANVAAGTFDTIGNAFNVSQNLNYITPKGIAKKMVKNTGKAVVIDYKRKSQEESSYVPAGVLYADLTVLKDANLKEAKLKEQ